MKNEELNLAELLKDCPKGTKFYSPMLGYVFLSAVKTNKIEIIIQDDDKVKTTTSVKVNGCFNNNFSDGECMLFPSKDQRDWNVWKEEQDKNNENPFKVGDYAKDSGDDIYKIIELKGADECVVHYLTEDVCSPAKCEYLTKIDKYPIERFQPFDKVLVRMYNDKMWTCDFFSHIDNSLECPFIAIRCSFPQCVPYNEETKHLVGTTEEAPEFYINWEEE